MCSRAFGRKSMRGKSTRRGRGGRSSRARRRPSRQQQMMRARGADRTLRWPPVSLLAHGLLTALPSHTSRRSTRYRPSLYCTHSHMHTTTRSSLITSSTQHSSSLSSQLCITVSMSASSNRNESGSSRSESGKEPIPESSVGSAVLSSIG